MTDACKIDSSEGSSGPDVGSVPTHYFVAQGTKALIVESPHLVAPTTNEVRRTQERLKRHGIVVSFDKALALVKDQRQEEGVLPCRPTGFGMSVSGMGMEARSLTSDEHELTARSRFDGSLIRTSEVKEYTMFQVAMHPHLSADHREELVRGFTDVYARFRENNPGAINGWSLAAQREKAVRHGRTG